MKTIETRFYKDLEDEMNNLNKEGSCAEMERDKLQINSNKKKEVFFLGLMYSDRTLEEARTLSKVGLQEAPHIFQQNLIKGFTEREDVSFRVINVPPIGSFPIHYKKAFLRETPWKEGYLQLGYINIPVLKHAIQEQRIKNLIEKQIDNRKDQYIFIYSMYPPYVRAANALKKRHPDLHVCLLQTDAILGKDGTYTKNTARNKKRGEKLIELMKSFDTFVVLTKYLAEAMEIGDKPYIVVDCIVNDEAKPAGTAQNRSKEGNRFLYTGSTRSTDGIVTLVDAFDYMPEGELWICGKGDSDEYIKAKEKKNSNIRFFGSIEHNRIAGVQAQCDFMINPRTPNGGFTKYSFPSKTAEYMMTEKPTVMYKLEGLSEDYDDLLNYIYSEEPKGLAEELRVIMHTDRSQLKNRAVKAREYVLREKTPKAQADRIIDMWDKTK